MPRRVFSLGAGLVGLVLAAVLVMGLAGTASAFAAQHKPVVTSVSPKTGLDTGGTKVTITGRYFKINGKSVVKKVTFGKKAATHVRVKSATSLTVTAPAGTGKVDVRVTTKAGTSRRVAGDKYTYGVSIDKYIVTASSYAPVAGADVTVTAQLASASSDPIHSSGAVVTWSKSGAGGSFGSATSTTDASGVATVTFTTGATVGTDYAVTATDGSSRTGTSPTIMTGAKALEVDHNGTPVKSYSLGELQALTPFAGYAGYKSSVGAILGPDAVTAAKVTDIVADALGTPLTAAESVEVAEASPFYGKNFSYDQLTDPTTGFALFTTSGASMSSFTGTVAAVLVYSDPAGVVMPAAKGPLRFFVADTVSETVMTGSFSISNVDTLNVIDPAAATQIAANAGDGQSASAGTAVSTKPSVIVEDVHNNPVPGVSVTFAAASGGGSATGLTATTNAAGIATVGSWTLGGSAGANTLTAASGTLTGSPVTFTATATAGVLQVKYNGTPVRAYSLTELQALTPFAGYAGLRSSGGSITGPDAVTGAKISDIVADALGTPLAAAESVEVTNLAPPAAPFTKTFAYDRLVSFAGFTMYNATTNTSVLTADLTGPLAAVLVYSDPAGLVMPAAKGPLRFFVADAAAADNVVMSPGSESVGTVNQLNVIDPAAATQIAANAGDGQSASAGTAVSTKPSVIVEDVHNNPVPGVSVTFAAASGGGSATGLTATTNAAGIATVGSWTLGGSAGANTLTAASGTLTGSPVTFTATGTAGVLQVKHNGTAVRSYSLTELQAVTPFAGYAGYKNKAGAILGPDAVTGARISDIVADALGTPLAAGESVEVAEAIPYFGSILPYAKVTDPGTGFTMYTTAGDPMTSFTGTLAAVLVYSDPAGVVMPAAKGPLRFFVADSISETLMTGSDSVTNVDMLNVIDP